MSVQHESWIKTPRQLITVVVVAFIVPITVIALLVQLVTGGDKGAKEKDVDIIARIQPVGQVRIAEASAPKGQSSGEQVFNQVCKNCHETGVAGAPKFGDKAVWARLIAQGQSTLVDHAAKGIRGMPPKGGNPDLDNVDVERAVVYMANKSGANWNEPSAANGRAPGDRNGDQVVAAVCAKCHQTGEKGAPKLGDRAAWTKRVANRGLPAVMQSALKGHAGMPARGGMAELSDGEVKSAVEYMMNSGVEKAPDSGAAAAAALAPAAAAPTPAAAAPAPAAAAAVAAAPPAAVAKADGKKVYDTLCTICHGVGVAGAPKLGDKAAWAPRLKPGMDALYATAIKGKNAMPPKGGNPALSDAEVKAAVDYMVAAAK